MKRILIADSHAMVRAGLGLLLTQTMDLESVDESGNAQETLAAVAAVTYDLVLMDVRMPEKNGLECMRTLRKQHPEVPVLVLSTYPEDQYAVRALRAGAAGYLTKDRPPRELITAVRRILAGDRYISDRLAQTLAQSVAAEGEGPPHARLSERELRVMLDLAKGRTVTEIGRDLNLSVKTISTYRTRVLQKMDMTLNAELIRYAVEHDLG
jgi:two-component system, NarL family, invasion response regulator UvrY